MASKHEQLQTITAQLESCASTTPNTTALTELQERVKVLEQERDDLKKVCQLQTHNICTHGTHSYRYLQKGTGCSSHQANAVMNFESLTIMYC